MKESKEVMARHEATQEAMRLGRMFALTTVQQDMVFASELARGQIEGDFTDQEKDAIVDAASGWCTKILDGMRVSFLAREALSALDVLEETLSALDRYVEKGEGTYTPRVLNADILGAYAALNPFCDSPVLARARLVLGQHHVPMLDPVRRELRAIIERGTVTEALYARDPDEGDGEPWGDVPRTPGGAS